jgi:PilZ domain/RDD family
MPSFPGQTPPAGAVAPVPDRRAHYRYPIHSLVYVNLDQGNGGIIRNLSEDGVAIQAVAAVQANQPLRLRFDLLSPRTRIEVQGDVSWATASGQAGVRFADMSPPRRRQLNDWVLTNLLRRIEQACPAIMGPVEGRDLILSPSARPPIRLPNMTASAAAQESGVRALAWWPRPISARTLARITDGLVIFSAVLIFLFIFLAMSQTLPAWPVTLGLAIGVFGVFAALYRCLFAVLGRGTAGVRLARIAIEGDEESPLPQPETRFR